MQISCCPNTFKIQTVKALQIILFKITYDKEKHEILTLEQLEPYKCLGIFV